MFKILTDSSALYTVEEGKALGLDVLPLVVTIQGKSYVEFTEMDSKTFYDLIKAGNIPTSSQPAVGGVIDYYEAHKEEGILVISMADGLSGTYASAAGAKEGIENNENIHVVNTQTLCGPHRYLVNLALSLRAEGKSLLEVKEVLLEKIQTNVSFLLPQDFEFLRRGGRVTKLAATLGGLFKLVPVVTQTPDGKRLDKFTTGRSFDMAIKAVVNNLKERGYNSSHLFYVSHGFCEGQAEKVKTLIEKTIENARVEILLLSPAFLTQGGPECVAIQAIKE